MTLQLAQSRRVKALSQRNADRILVHPARYKSDVVLPDESTAAGYLINALDQGTSLSEIEAETGWSKATVMINLYKVAKKSGVGIHRRSDIMYLMLPEGAEGIHPSKQIIRNETVIDGCATRLASV
ncbi:hypothetical protein [Roseobacter sp.]|uniref:hypothetical protein n=1 Tax=Roseobacter sp. TaxID=1907202 RepID=UPI00385EAC05